MPPNPLFKIALLKGNKKRYCRFKTPPESKKTILTFLHKFDFLLKKYAAEIKPALLLPFFPGFNFIEAEFVFFFQTFLRWYIIFAPG